jgi:hypothetical protein
MIDFEVKGERELTIWLDTMPDAVKRIVADRMTREVETLYKAVKTNLEEYAPSTLGNWGFRATGKLAKSIQTNVVTGADSVEGIVFSDGSVPYALVQEYGGGGEGVELAPVTARVMAFIWQGSKWFSAGHIRGQTPAKRYLRNALDAEKEGILTRLNSEIVAALNQTKGTPE